MAVTDGAPGPDPGGALPFLVFELRGQPYGVAVDQVQAIVPCQPGAETCIYEGQEIPVQAFARWIGLEPEGQQLPRVLISRSRRAPRGLLVDTPRDIVTLPLDAIYPLPVLIRRLLAASPLWGVGRHDKELILLVNVA